MLRREYLCEFVDRNPHKPEFPMPFSRSFSRSTDMIWKTDKSSQKCLGEHVDSLDNRRDIDLTLKKRITHTQYHGLPSLKIL